MLIGAGLPKVFQFIGNARTYAERIFRYEEIDSLTDDEARDAIVVPAEEEGKKIFPMSQRICRSRSLRSPRSAHS